MKRIFLLLSAVIMMLALGSIVFTPFALAHSEPKECTPPIDGTMTTAPDKVVCTMTQALDAKQSKLEVFDSAGVQVDKGDSQVDLNNPDRNTISVSLDTTKMKGGVYTVKWETFSTDDNEEANGEFKFTVGSPSAAQPTAAATTEPTAAPTNAPEPTATQAAPEPTVAPTPSPEITLPATGAAMSNLGFVLIAFLGLLLLGFGLMVRARH